MLVLYHTATLDTTTLDGLSPNTGAHCTSTSNTGRASWLRSLWQVLALRQMEGQPVLMPRYDRCILVDEFRSGQFPRDNGCVAQNVGGFLAVAPASRSLKGWLSARDSPFWLDDISGLGMLIVGPENAPSCYTHVCVSWTRLTCPKSFLSFIFSSHISFSRNERPYERSSIQLWTSFCIPGIEVPFSYIFGLQLYL